MHKRHHDPLMAPGTDPVSPSPDTERPAVLPAHPSDPMKPANAPLSHRARVGDALDLLHRVLHPYIEREMQAVYGARWEREARGVLHGKPIETWDTSDLLTLLYTKFHQVFRSIGHEGRSRVSLLREIRKKWAHQGALSIEETRRTLETTILLLRTIGAESEAARLEPHVLELMRAELEEHLALGDDPAHTDRLREAIEARRQAAEAPGTAAEPRPSRLSQGFQRLRALWHRSPSEPLELRRALLDAIELAAEPYRRQFPFNRLIVHLHTPDERTRQLYTLALEGQREPFGGAVLRRLADARIPVPGSLHISWRLHRTPPKKLEAPLKEQPFHVEFQRRRPSGTATLKILKGRAAREAYVLRGGTSFTLGRQAEVTDEGGRVVWRNTVAFLDYEDPRLSEEERQIHTTISRVHARISYDEADDVFRLHDEQSTCGTSVVREGFLVPFQVRQQAVPLQDGDLIYLGKACLRFTLGRPSSRSSGRASGRGSRRSR